MNPKQDKHKKVQAQTYYIQTAYTYREKFETVILKMPFTIAPKTENVSYKPNKACTECIYWKWQNTDERNPRRPK